MARKKKKQASGFQRVLDEITARMVGGESKRSRAGVKATLTRRRNAAKRSSAARKGARTRRARGRR